MSVCLGRLYQEGTRTRQERSMCLVKMVGSLWSRHKRMLSTGVGGTIISTQTIDEHHGIALKVRCSVEYGVEVCSFLPSQWKSFQIMAFSIYLFRPCSVVCTPLPHLSPPSEAIASCSPCPFVSKRPVPRYLRFS